MEDQVNPYEVRQLDAHHEVLSETQVLASSYHAALRQLADVAQEARRIEVYKNGERAGSIDANYWRRNVRRK